MNTSQNIYSGFADMTMEEYDFIQNASGGLSANQMQTFILVYNSRRKNPQDILIGTIMGFLGLAGVQRFMTNQFLLGLLYFFTFGFLGVGTLLDLLTYKSIANQYNRGLADECYQIARAAN
jgi:TM2 domain-containing membrane protein YozV